jgi:hypothetical protein
MRARVARPKRLSARRPAHYAIALPPAWCRVAECGSGNGISGHCGPTTGRSHEDST